VELPLVGFSLSQAASSVSDQFSVPPPEFHISSVLLAGFESPSTALKGKLDGLKDISLAPQVVPQVYSQVVSQVGPVQVLPQVAPHVAPQVAAQVRPEQVSSQVRPEQVAPQVGPEQVPSQVRP